MAGWGVAYVPSAWLVEDVPPLLAAALRLSLAGGLLLAVMVLSGRSLHPEVGWGVVAWIGFTQTTLFYGATFWGLDREGAGLAAVLANTDPLFVAVLSSWLLGEVLRGGQWLGLVVGFLGTALAVSHQQVWPPTASVDSLIVVGGALAWSIGTVVAARQVRDPLEGRTQEPLHGIDDPGVRDGQHRAPGEALRDLLERQCGALLHHRIGFPTRWTVPGRQVARPLLFDLGAGQSLPLARVALHQSGHLEHGSDPHGLADDARGLRGPDQR